MFHSEYESRLRSPSRNSSSSPSIVSKSNTTSSPRILPFTLTNQNHEYDNHINNNNLIDYSQQQQQQHDQNENNPAAGGEKIILRSPQKLKLLEKDNNYGDRFIPMPIGNESHCKFSTVDCSPTQSSYYSSNSSLSSNSNGNTNIMGNNNTTNTNTMNSNNGNNNNNNNNNNGMNGSQRDERHYAYNLVLKNELLGGNNVPQLSTTSISSNNYIYNSNSLLSLFEANHHNMNSLDYSSLVTPSINNNNNTSTNNTHTNVNSNQSNNGGSTIFNHQPNGNSNNSIGNSIVGNSNGRNKNNDIFEYNSISSLSTSSMSSSSNSSSILQYKSPKKKKMGVDHSPYSLSPLSCDSQKLLSSPRKPQRKISKVPFKVLDAPAILDDFYLNLVDWSSQNVLAVGLEKSVYLWNAVTSQVSKLCDYGINDNVTSVSWIESGTHLAVGGNDGIVKIWDVNKKKKIRELQGHTARVNTMAWNNHILSSGSKDRSILHHDVRDSSNYIAKLLGHRNEICGLKWSPDGQQLASGGNDNLLCVWDNSMYQSSYNSNSNNVNNNNVSSSSRNSTTSFTTNNKPLYQFKFHNAAVKAIAWSPHQRGLLASGGGTHDKCIRFWNTSTGASIQSIDTGSQVCNLAWSKNVNELVSTHGYSQNQITVWSYPSMSPVATLTGHTTRVLYLAVSPDGSTIVTGAGDQTLRFWNVFPSAKESNLCSPSTSLDSLMTRSELGIR